MAYQIKYLGLMLMVGMVVLSCEDDDFEEGELIFKRNDIERFEFPELVPVPVGLINKATKIIRVNVPEGTDVANLTPFIEISENAVISPQADQIQDFSDQDGPVQYTVTSQHGESKLWTIEINFVPLGLLLSEPIWEQREGRGNIPSWFSDNGERGLDYGNDVLYVTTHNDKVRLIDPADRRDLGTLPDPDNIISGGQVILSDVEVSNDGKILACNAVDSENGVDAPFKIYIWENNSAKPSVFLEFSNTEYRMGDSFTVIGDIEGDAVIYTAFGRKFLEPATRGNTVFRWKITGGVLNPAPDIIDIEGLPTLGKFGSRPHVYALGATGEEDLYVCASEVEFTHVDKDGTFIDRLPNQGRTLFDGFTNQFEMFTMDAGTFIAAIFPRSNIESRFMIIDITNGLANVTRNNIFFTEDFVAGQVDNADASGGITVNKLSEGEVEIYCLITNQALVKYKFVSI